MRAVKKEKNRIPGEVAAERGTNGGIMSLETEKLIISIREMFRLHAEDLDNYTKWAASLKYYTEAEFEALKEKKKLYQKDIKLLK